MGIKEKVSQLFIVRCPDTWEDIEYFLRQKVGGFMIGKGGEIVSKKQFALEGNSKESLKQFIERLKEKNERFGNEKLFLAIDGEGGKYFNRLKEFTGLREQRYYGELYEETRDVSKYSEDVSEFFEVMAYIGFNMNFAPVVDVAMENYKGYVAEEKIKIEAKELTQSEIASSRRAYSDKPAVVKTLSQIPLREMKKRKIIGTCKHFPSYGYLPVDKNPHEVLATLNVSKKKLVELISPYEFLIKRGLCPMIMKGHVISPLSNVLNSTSNEVEKFLREKFSFNGLSIVDELNMGAVRQFYGENYVKKAAVDAAYANDIILISHPETFIPMRDAIMKKAERDKGLVEKIDESLERIYKAKDPLLY